MQCCRSKSKSRAGSKSDKQLSDTDLDPDTGAVFKKNYEDSQPLERRFTLILNFFLLYPVFILI
jgi:hypothetical protein